MKLLPSLRSVLTVSVGLAAITLSQSALAEPLRLNFGVYSSNKPSAMVRVFIRMQIAKDYDQGISHLTTGKVDFSRFGPASYIEAKKMNEGIEILAMESKKGAKVFYGIIATKNDSDIQSVEDLRDRSFAFGDEGSTIGRFLSQLYLEQNGIRADDLSKYEYLGRHDRVGTAVGAGDFDAGALNESTYKKLIEAGEPLRELVKFPNVTKPWIARSGLDPVIFEALQLSLLEIRDEKALKGLKIVGFLNGDDTDYAEIREAMDFNHKFFEDPSDVADNSATVIKNNEVAAPETVATTEAVIKDPAKTVDEKAVAAASSIIAEQAQPTVEPTTAAALPTATAAASALTATQQDNATRVATALAEGSVTAPVATQQLAPQAQAVTTAAPSNFAVNGNNLTINIELPAQLMNQYGPNGNSQNVTINLSFPAEQSNVDQAIQ